ncbi:tetratricopeptide repeat protein [Nostocaceae cyanobacterium CENA369]|uniref:Tetratricopeptide repeat protein n=1 Tax=Dendronalium phyllosphericum CENA369 TaxID=1725256 RepID=A0A8J7IB22_9NOST|nr:tetratricopeptide repeat protein [Dendronalium phyllosphericum]MBH8575547.1 tetratricopeptide repeat protein [Dendronalium phyllosphericum CENA369]
MLRRLIFTIVVILFSNSLALAETKNPEELDKFPPSPLEITTPDPLLPNLSGKQQLTPEQQLNLELALNELNQQATAKLQAGDKVAAFEIWNRELRLRRFLGALAEVQALSRVGAIAWNESERQEIYYITQRLQAIQKQAQPPKNVAKKTVAPTTVNLELLRSLAEAYQNVRSFKPALEVYNQILAVRRQQQNEVAVVQTLQTIGELNLAWFDYPQAATTYEELLNLATSVGDRPNELIYLQQLAYIYEQGKQPQQAINVRDKLAKIYTDENDLTKIPVLKIAIGSNYESLAKENPNLLREAFNNYQEAYNTAWQLQEYTRAGEALQKLIALYRSQGQTDEALQASQILLETQQRAVNFYGLMQTYDQIGQIYLERKDYAQARTAFQQGLELAQQLKLPEAHFTQQIEKLPK